MAIPPDQHGVESAKKVDDRVTARAMSSGWGLTSRVWWVGLVIWGVGLAAWYAITAIHSLRHPWQPGLHWLWGGLWISAVVAVCASHVLWRKAGVTRAWLGGLACSACLMLILSRQLLSALICTWLLVVAWAWGMWILRCLGGSKTSWGLEDVAISVALGLGLLSLMTMGIALIGGLYPAVAWAMILVGTLLHRRAIYVDLTRAVPHIVRAWRSPGRSAALAWIEQRVLVVLAGFVFLANLVWTLTPEIQFDALNYHLAVPKFYIEQHRVVDLPYFFHSYFAHLVDMLYALALLLHGQSVAKLLMLSLGLLVAGAIGGFGRAYFSPRVGLWAAVLFYTTPLVSWLSSTTDIDLAVALFLFTAVSALMRWELTRAYGWLVITGLLAGEALGAKLPSVFGILPLSVVLMWRLRAYQGAAPLARCKQFGGVVLSGGLMAIPWFVVIWVLTGNPVFPFLNAIFQSPGWTSVNSMHAAGEYGIGTSLASVASLPFALTYDATRFGVSAGALGAALLMALPMGLRWRRDRCVVTKILLVWSIGYMVLWAVVVQNARFLIPLWPSIVLLAASTAHSPGVLASWVHRSIHVSFSVVLVAQGLMIPSQFWNIPERFPVRLALGLETPEAFLARVLPGYEAVRYLNSVAQPAHDKVIGVGGSEGLRFYLHVPLESLSESPAMQLAAVFAPGRQLASALARHGSTYLLDIRQPSPAEYLDPPYRHPRFLESYATAAWVGHDASVYRLTPPVQAPNALDNPGFEELDPAGMPFGWVASGRPVLDQTGQHARTGFVALQVGPTAWVYQYVLVEPGLVYTLRHWTRADRPGQLARLQINWLDKDLQLVDVSIAVVSAGPLWGWHEMSAYAPDHAAIAQVYASVHTDGEVWFDDMWFAPGGTVPETQ